MADMDYDNIPSSLGGSHTQQDRDNQQDGSIRYLQQTVLWLTRGIIGLMVVLGLLVWWVVLKGCG